MEDTRPETPTCQRCGKDLIGRVSFLFKPPRPSTVADNPDGNSTGNPANNPDTAAGAVKCLVCSLTHRPMLKRSAIASLVVGTILTLLNQGDLLLSGQWSGALWWKIPLTYCVPFLVATYGALTNSRR